MITRALRMRYGARVAILGLALGVSALGALALWSIASTSATTQYVRDADEVTVRWSQVLLAVNAENDAITDYLRTASDAGRLPLASAIGSADANLDWLATHGAESDRAQARSVRETYASYSDTLRLMVEDGRYGDQPEVRLLADQAALGSAALRKQARAGQVQKRLETTAHLAEVDQRNATFRTAGAVICAADFLLLLICGYVLRSYQRRLHRQSETNLHQARHDSLTGIANRALLGEHIDAALTSGVPVGLLLLDLDRFKEINDTLGHHYGDLLLQQVASRLTDVVADHPATVARLGGDEFAILLPGVEGTALMAVAERALAAIQQPASLDGTVVDVGGSIGAALYPADSANASELFKHADIAMYAAKRGKLGTARYDAGAVAHTSDRLLLQGELHRAIEDRELVLYYQPKVETRTGRICGVEALVRWDHPVRGMITPDEFIPLAQESDLIQRLTVYVLDEALRQHRTWLLDGLVLPVAVNIPPRCLTTTGLSEQVAELLARHGVEPDQLTLEITESAVVGDREVAGEVLHRLRAVGVRLSMDDFGTGYSSMIYLQTLPLNELKIDHRFIRSTQPAATSQAIVTAVLDVAHALNLQVVAEGVADDATLRDRDALNFDVVQGYELCGPVTPTELVKWLADQPDRTVAALAAQR